MISPPTSHNDVTRIAFIVGAVTVPGLLVWLLSEVWVLSFAAILFAVILRSLASRIEQYTPFGAPWSLMLAIVTVALIGAAFVFLLGFQIKEQFVSLMEQLPVYFANIGDQLGIEDLQEKMAERAEGMSLESGLPGMAATYTTGTISAITSFGLILITGIYLAANPQHYLRGTLVSVGLSVIGLPSALALGFMAGIAEFIPILGPVLAAAPAILIAFSEDRNTLFWVIALYVAVQQLESYVIMPLVQRKAVHLPAVLTILSIVGFGTLLGLPGIVMAAPLAVTLMVAVERLYVRGTLGKDVKVPGEEELPGN